MQSQQMQAITGKELSYISDSLSNENLLIKQCAATAASIQNHAIIQVLEQHIMAHKQHADTLIQSLEQHQPLAPTQPMS
ncbi:MULTISPECIES: hypothetical protein [unclassified Paenibacillus]|uniref:Spore coat protein n=1 Tax=Paenibacillus provencensis TaxID=441151 RepID=A0ABW3PTH6_9BACL|nr:MULTISPECIES: hypothetical protein [unclassified Paenibacillus]MCM3127399.1 hypothetical protein [Paenibacillus sp. MER 78]SFS43209.1 hypothetical protein SAMN04488601_101595 [Paenibacillus sp. 453mf]